MNEQTSALELTVFECAYNALLTSHWLTRVVTSLAHKSPSKSSGKPVKSFLFARCSMNTCRWHTWDNSSLRLQVCISVRWHLHSEKSFWKGSNASSGSASFSWVTCLHNFSLTLTVASSPRPNYKVLHCRLLMSIAHSSAACYLLSAQCLLASILI